MTNDLFGMSDAEHLQWLRDQGIPFIDISQPSEEALCKLVSDALRTLSKEDRAQTFIDIANMSLALADKAMGAQAVLPQCLVLELKRH